MVSCIIPKKLLHAAPPLEFAKMVWLDRLDAIDPFYGNPDAIEEMVFSAPTLELAAWLGAQVVENRHFVAQLFKR